MIVIQFIVFLLFSSLWHRSYVDGRLLAGNHVQDQTVDNKLDAKHGDRNSKEGIVSSGKDPRSLAYSHRATQQVASNIIPVSIGMDFIRPISDVDLFRGFKVNIASGEDPFRNQVFTGDTVNQAVMSGNTFSRIITKATDIEDSLSIGGSFSLSYGPASGSAYGQYTDNKVYRRNYQSIVYRHQHIAYSKKIVDSSLVPVNGVQGMSTDEIARRYGTEFVNTIYYGAQLEVEFVLSASEDVDLDTIAVTLEGEIGTPVINGKFQAEFDFIKSTNAESLSLSINARLVGINLPIGSNPSFEAMNEIITEFNQKYDELIATISEQDDVDSNTNILNRLTPVGFSLGKISSYLTQLNPLQTAELDYRMKKNSENFFNLLFLRKQIDQMAKEQEERFKELDARAESETFKPYKAATLRVIEQITAKISECLSFRSKPFLELIDPFTRVPDTYPRDEYEMSVVSGLLGRLYIPPPVTVGTTIFESVYFEGYAIPTGPDGSLEPWISGSLRYMSNNELVAQENTIAELEVEGYRKINDINPQLHDYVKYGELVYLQSNGIESLWLRPTSEQDVGLENSFESENGLWKFRSSTGISEEPRRDCVRYGDTVYLEEQNRNTWLGRNYFGIYQFKKNNSNGPFYILQHDRSLCPYPLWPDDFGWSNEIPNGSECVPVVRLRFVNIGIPLPVIIYFCWKSSCSGNLGIRHSTTGPIPNMRCTHLVRSTLNFNTYLCVPNDSPLYFEWYHGATDNIPSNLSCQQWEHDYYLCANPILTKNPILRKPWDSLGVPGITNTVLTPSQTHYLADHLVEINDKDRYQKNFNQKTGWVVKGESNSYGQCVQKLSKVYLQFKEQNDLLLSVEKGALAMKSEVAGFSQWTIRASKEDNRNENGFTCGAITAIGMWEHVDSVKNPMNNKDGVIIAEFQYGIQHPNNYPSTWNNTQSWIRSVKSTITGNLTVKASEKDGGTISYQDIDKFYGHILAEEVENAIKCQEPIWPNDFGLYFVEPEGYKCVNIFTLPDNFHGLYLCWKSTCNQNNLGIQWSESGEIDGMRCTQIFEPLDPHSSDSNYLCVPLRSKLYFKWFHSTPPDDVSSCIKWGEVSGWDDNYLCANRDPRSSVTIDIIPEIVTPRQVWQFIYDIKDECTDSWLLRTNQLAVTKSSDAKPCCLPGFENNQFDANGSCRLSSPCLCEESICKPKLVTSLPTITPSAAPSQTPSAAPSKTPTATGSAKSKVITLSVVTIQIIATLYISFGV